MKSLPFPAQFLVLALAGWLNRHQLDTVDYLREENRVLREMLGKGRLRITERQQTKDFPDPRPLAWRRTFPRGLQRILTGAKGARICPCRAAPGEGTWRRDDPVTGRSGRDVGS